MHRLDAIGDSELRETLLFARTQARPVKTYRVAPEMSAIEFPRRRYEQLVGLLCAALPPRTRIGRLREVGTAFGRILAREARLRSAKTFRVGLRRVCAGLGGLGYQAFIAEVSDERAVIATATCPLRPLVRSHPELRELDRRMWAALVGEAVEGVDAGEIGCETQRCFE